MSQPFGSSKEPNSRDKQGRYGPSCNKKCKEAGSVRCHCFDGDGKQDKRTEKANEAKEDEHDPRHGHGWFNRFHSDAVPLSLMFSECISRAIVFD